MDNRGFLWIKDEKAYSDMIYLLFSWHSGFFLNHLLVLKNICNDICMNPD